MTDGPTDGPTDTVAYTYTVACNGRPFQYNSISEDFFFTPAEIIDIADLENKESKEFMMSNVSLRLETTQI